jgi:hypothetical protein
LVDDVQCDDARPGHLFCIRYQDFTKYTTNEAMTVDKPANKKFVSCFIAYLGFQEKKHLMGKDWLMKGFAGNFITPRFVLLTVAFDLPPLLFLHYLSFPRSWPYDFYFFFSLLLPCEK